MKFEIIKVNEDGTIEVDENGEAIPITDKSYKVAMRVYRNNRSTARLRKRDKHEAQVLGKGVIQ